MREYNQKSLEVLLHRREKVLMLSTLQTEKGR